MAEVFWQLLSVAALLSKTCLFLLLLVRKIISSWLLLWLVFVVTVWGVNANKK